MPAVQPGDVRAMLPVAAPEQGEGWDAIVADLDRIVVPGTTHWQHPGWYAYFPANGSGPSILGELVAAGLGVQGMLWSTGPVCTELETHVIDWLVDLLALPSHFRSDGTGGGVIQHSASDAALCAIVAARRAGRHRGRPAGGVLLDADALLGGEGSPRRRHPAPARDRRRRRLAMRPDELARQIAADRAAGLRPFFCCASLGTTSSLALRPGPARSARSAGTPGCGCTSTPRWPAWPRICPEHRWLNDGVELASKLCHQRRTSGCSRTSTATCSGSPTGRR